MNVLSLFTGIGGLDLGLERAGMTIVGQVERDPWCRRVLGKHWPGVPLHDDVATCTAWWRGAPRPAVDAVVGGFPCQPVSVAGRRLAQSDPRWLWPLMAVVVADLRPAWIVIENVPGLQRRGLDVVLHDLDGLGYRTRAGLASACAVGAPHTRDRMFILAHTAGLRCGAGRVDGAGPATAHRTPDEPGAETDRGSGWAREPDVDRVAYGVPGRMDRMRALGNAVVPQVAERIGHLVMATLEQEE